MPLAALLRACVMAQPRWLPLECMFPGVSPALLPLLSLAVLSPREQSSLRPYPRLAVLFLGQAGGACAKRSGQGELGGRAPSRQQGVLTRKRPLEMSVNRLCYLRNSKDWDEKT